MTINQRQKGAAAERQLAGLLRELGFPDARRTAQYNGNGLVGDVCCNDTLPNVSIECKAVAGLTLGTDKFEKHWKKAQSDAGEKKPVMFWKPKNNGVFYMTFRDDKAGLVTVFVPTDIVANLKMLNGGSKQ